MTDIQTFLQGVLAGLTALAPTAGSVVLQTRRLEPAKVAEMAGDTLPTPALCVALTGIPRVELVASGERDAVLALSCMIATTDTPDLPRDTAAHALMTDLVAGLPGATWAIPNAHPAKAVMATDLTTAAIDQTGVMLWDITWSQTLRLGTDAFTIDGQIKSLYVGLAPNIGAAHRADYRDFRTGEAPDDA